MTEIDIEQRQRQGIKRTLVVIVCFITVVFGLFVNRLSMDRILSPKELVANGAIMFSSPREIGDFNLLDQNQATFTKQQLQGQWSFVFFGFTHCPDICPTTLVMMNELNEFLLDTPYAEDTQFLMVSLDPARDTPIKLKPYIEYFNSDFIVYLCHVIAKKYSTSNCQINNSNTPSIQLKKPNEFPNDMSPLPSGTRKIKSSLSDTFSPLR